MADIFQEAGLPLWLRPYEVLVTSSYTALIETIPDTVILYTCSFPELITSKFHTSLIMSFVVLQASLHSIKSRYPNITSLRHFFVAKYQENSPTFKLAQVMCASIKQASMNNRFYYISVILIMFIAIDCVSGVHREYILCALWFPLFLVLCCLFRVKVGRLCDLLIRMGTLKIAFNTLVCLFILWLFVCNSKN